MNTEAFSDRLFERIFQMEGVVGIIDDEDEGVSVQIDEDSAELRAAIMAAAREENPNIEVKIEFVGKCTG